jgi:hypothetical protein
MDGATAWVPATRNVVQEGKSRIAGLSFRQGGAWVESPARPFNRDLDSLPFPKSELLSYQRYRLLKSAVILKFRCCLCLVRADRMPPLSISPRARSIRDLGINYMIFRNPCSH